MGGYGSGRYRWKNLDIEDRYRHRRISIIDLRNQFEEKTGLSFRGCPSVEVSWKIQLEDGIEEYNQNIFITWTPCYFGGKRPWFVCPRCQARAVYLYHLDLFACRKCQRLTYETQSVIRHTRLIWKRDHLEARLDPDRERPKGMHRKTYDRILDQLETVDRDIEEEGLIRLLILLDRHGHPVPGVDVDLLK